MPVFIKFFDSTLINAEGINLMTISKSPGHKTSGAHWRLNINTDCGHFYSFGNWDAQEGAEGYLNDLLTKLSSAKQFGVVDARSESVSLKRFETASLVIDKLNAMSSTIQKGFNSLEHETRAVKNAITYRAN